MQIDVNNLPPGVPPEAVPFLQEIGYLEPDRLKSGDIAPRLTLSTLDDNTPVEIGNPNASQPTVLIYGSYT